MTRTIPAAPPGALVALSLVVCLGAVAHGQLMPQFAPVRGERPVLSVQDREALASLLSCFTDAARRLQPAPQAHALVTGRPTLSLGEALLHRFAPPEAEGPPVAVPVHVHRLNLPPPALA